MSSIDDKWETYQREFEEWLEKEIKTLEQKLEDLKKIKEKLGHDKKPT